MIYQITEIASHKLMQLANSLSPYSFASPPCNGFAVIQYNSIIIIII